MAHLLLYSLSDEVPGQPGALAVEVNVVDKYGKALPGYRKQIVVGPEIVAQLYASASQPETTTEQVLAALPALAEQIDPMFKPETVLAIAGAQERAQEISLMWPMAVPIVIPPAELILTVEPAEIVRGQTAMLRFEARNARFVFLSWPGYEQVVNEPGELVVSPEHSITYIMTALDRNEQSVRAEVTLSVVLPE